MVDLIEIAKPLTRLKSIRQTQRSGTFRSRITSGTLNSVSSYSGVAQKGEIFVSDPTEPYDKDDAFHLLVQRVEALLSKESGEWVQSMMKLPEGEKRS